MTWQPLDAWGARHGFAPAREMARSPVATYAVTTSSGVFVVQIGSLAAYWDGMELHLGFAPQLIEGKVFLHALDLHKNLEPLARPFSSLATGGRVIVIDPGHGGGNTGTKSVLDAARFEKEFTLDWALRLAPLLETNGWRVFLTRTNDAELPLGERVEFAEEQHADVFISLHFNSAAPSREPAGLETFCITPTGMASTFNHDYDDDPSLSYPNNAFDEQNLALASRLHRSLLAASGFADRGVRRARFLGVLRRQNRPAVLIEVGYLSNPEEAKKIADPGFRQKLAEAVAAALK